MSRPPAHTPARPHARMHVDTEFHLPTTLPTRARSLLLQAPNCSATFHPICASKKGCKFGLSAQAAETVVYCNKHAKLFKWPGLKEDAAGSGTSETEASAFVTHASIAAREKARAKSKTKVKSKVSLVG